MVAQNGIADGTLRPVPGEPGARLRWDAAASWGRMCDEVVRRRGWRPRLTSAGDAFRTYAVQEAIFRQRYTPTGPTAVDRVGKPWQGRRWYRLPVWAAAATPGTSNHGFGVACDVTALGGFRGARFDDFDDIANAHGWDNREGASIAEPWHWRYRPENDRHHGTTTVTNTGAVIGGPGIPAPGGTLPGLLTPKEDDLANVTDAQLAALLEGASNAWETRKAVAGVLEHVIENRRMLGVLLGYNAPANDTERAALTVLQGAGENATEARRMLGVLLGWNGPEGPEQEALAALRAAAEGGDPVAASAVADELGRRLSATKNGA